MSDLILTGGSAASITSAEIAELVGSRHDSVKRTVERLAEQGVISLPPTVEVKIQRERREESVTVFRFTGDGGKRDSIVVVAQLSPEFTARLVDRWQELEAKVRQPAIPQTLPEALRLAADLAEQNAALAVTVQEQTPKVEAFARIADAEGSLCMRDAAKALQIRPIDLKNLLIVNRWIYGRPGHTGWLAYQDKIQQGLMTHKVDTVTRQDGTEKVVEQVRVTPKGITRLAQMLQPKAA